MKRLLTIGSLVVSLLAGTAAVAAVPASASIAPPNCPSGALCAFVGYDYGLRMGKVYQNNPDLWRYTAFANAHSLYNNGRYCNATVWYGANYTGKHYNLNRGTGWEVLGSNIAAHVYSNKWCLY